MASFGEELKRERELRQISLREVAEATKINPRYLEALEINDFRHLPGGVFNKGFVRAYSEYIGIDPEAQVNAYLLEELGQSQPAGPDVVRRSKPAAAPAERAEAGPARRARPRRRLALVLLLILAAVLAIAGVVALAWVWPPLHGLFS